MEAEKDAGTLTALLLLALALLAWSIWDSHQSDLRVYEGCERLCELGNETYQPYPRLCARQCYSYLTDARFRENVRTSLWYADENIPLPGYVEKVSRAAGNLLLPGENESKRLDLYNPEPFA